MPKLAALLPKVHFLSSSPDYASLPGDDGAEVAFAGRSNAGKSSVLNTLVNRKALAKISSAPGKTRHINLFGLDDAGRLRLADLPGYGYAKVSAAEQERWGRELTRYITERRSLKGVVVVMDIRHPLAESDRQMLTLCRTGGRRVHVLLNKADKLTGNRRAKAMAAAEKDLAFLAPGATLSPFSALKRSGRDELLSVLETWLTEDS